METRVSIMLNNSVTPQTTSSESDRTVESAPVKQLQPKSSEKNPKLVCCRGGFPHTRILLIVHNDHNKHSERKEKTSTA